MNKGQCHCGNIQLKIPHLTETGTSCTCSICSRYGSIWGFFTDSEVDVTIGEQGMSSYCHGDKMIEFNRCNQCGCMTHYTSTAPGPDSRVAVNYRMFPARVLKQIRIRLFDGADTWQYLD
ncbi:GFA family protein [Endozoicomonadaceae bacterium StTr2]